jgi:hypothetical protein
MSDGKIIRKCALGNLIWLGSLKNYIHTSVKLFMVPVRNSPRIHGADYSI